MTNHDHIPTFNHDLDPEECGVEELNVEPKPDDREYEPDWSADDPGLSPESAEELMDARNDQDARDAKKNPDFWANQ
ncbi:hypothetical protein CR969_02160 [Candidatus Saccharibacteria bacterium]|nr:MAG: hypothetical protein CR969_02160 [Candidatus Saccharibacteria bacterium]